LVSVLLIVNVFWQSDSVVDCLQYLTGKHNFIYKRNKSATKRQQKKLELTDSWCYNAAFDCRKFI